MPLTNSCPCCGYKMELTSFDICDICFWENDPVQAENADMTGANRVTLRQAQANFAAFGAAEKQFAGTDNVRPPGPEDERDPNWKPLGGMGADRA